MTILNQKFFDGLYKDVIGARELADRLNGFYNGHSTSTSFPPYNIVEHADDKGYSIQLAVAGFSKNEITITNEDNNLIVSGEKTEPLASDGDILIHCGIAARKFERKFLLNENVIVKGAEYKDGILHIGLERIIPKKEKTKLIQIS